MPLFKNTSVSFLRLWIGNTASGLATWALPFVLGLLVAGGSLTSTELGVSLAARTIGFLIAMPISGVLADRTGPRRIVLAASIAGAAGIPIIALGLAIGGPYGTAILLLGSVIAGMGQGACRPAYQALMPEFVPPEKMQSANAAMSISVRVTNFLGPATAMGIALVFGNSTALLGIALLWLASGLVPPRSTRKRSSHGARLRSDDSCGILISFAGDLKEGFREALHHTWFIAGLAALTSVIATGYSVASVILPTVSRDAFGGTVLLTGSATAYTLGALMGAIIITRWRPINQGWVALMGLGMYALVPFSLSAPAHVAIPIVAFFFAGVGIEVFNVPWFTSVQNEMPPEKLARVSSVDFLFSYGLAPLGLLVMVPATEQFGRGFVLIVCGCVCLIAPACAMLVPSTKAFSGNKLKDS